LKEIGPAAAEAVPALVQNLSDEDMYVRQTAAEALGAIVTDDEAVVAALIAAMADEKRFVQLAAAAALWRIERRQDALDFVFAGLKDEPWITAHLLAELGADAAEALEALRLAARHPEFEVRRKIADTIQKIERAE
jgi:HEAT repeat protein